MRPLILVFSPTNTKKFTKSLAVCKKYTIFATVET